MVPPAAKFEVSKTLHTAVPEQSVLARLNSVPVFPRIVNPKFAQALIHAGAILEMARPVDVAHDLNRMSACRIA